MERSPDTSKTCCRSVLRQISSAGVLSGKEQETHNESGIWISRSDLVFQGFRRYRHLFLLGVLGRSTYATSFLRKKKISENSTEMMQSDKRTKKSSWIVRYCQLQPLTLKGRSNRRGDISKLFEEMQGHHESFSCFQGGITHQGFVVLQAT